MTLRQHYDVRKFDGDAILFREMLCKKEDILMIRQRFQCSLGWNQVNNARLTITHVCFIALTLARSSDNVWTFGLTASCSNSFLRTRQMLMHEKNTCDPYIVMWYLPINTDGKNKCIGTFKIGEAMFRNQFGDIGNSRKNKRKKNKLSIFSSTWK